MDRNINLLRRIGAAVRGLVNRRRPHMRQEGHERGRLAAALERLPEPQRTVYRLCAIDEVSYELAAVQLGLAVTEVERLLADALTSLAADLDAIGQGAAVASGHPAK